MLALFVPDLTPGPQDSGQLPGVWGEGMGREGSTSYLWVCCSGENQQEALQKGAISKIALL